MSSSGNELTPRRDDDPARPDPQEPIVIDPVTREELGPISFVMSQSWFSGPLPPPTALTEYDQALDAGSPILHRDRQAKSAPLAASLIASAPMRRLGRSITVSSEEAGGAERVGVGAGEDAGGGGTLAAGDRAAAGDQPSHRDPTRQQRAAAAVPPRRGWL